MGDDLAVYLDTPDLTTPARRCALKSLISETWAMSCLRDIGFTNDCARIWFYNAANTRKRDANGGCFGVCIAHIATDNNEAVSVDGNNPCEPDPSIEAVSGDTCSLETCTGGFVDPRNMRHRQNYCRNTINGKGVCSESQWQDNPYRINACLQCDECRSGPIFQKIAGRTRRASGIKSAID